MAKEATQHIIYALVLVILVSGIVYLQQRNLDEMESMLNTLNENLQSQNDILISYISDLRKDATQKNETIKILQAEISQLKSKTLQVEEQITSLQIENQDFSAIIPSVLKSVVVIKTNVALGSGFIVDPEGYIATNYHVVEDATAGYVSTSDKVIHKVRIVGFDKNADVAVLKIDGSFNAILFGDSTKVQIGQKVIAVGSPDGFEYSVTQGIISSTDRRDLSGNRYFQIDAAINPGSSGGPLIDGAGKVIGMNTLKITGQEGLGFALQGSQVMDIAFPFVDADKRELLTGQQ